MVTSILFTIDMFMDVCICIIIRWSEGLHGVADSPGVHFNGMVCTCIYIYDHFTFNPSLSLYSFIMLPPFHKS